MYTLTTIILKHTTQYTFPTREEAVSKALTVLKGILDRTPSSDNAVFMRDYIQWLDKGNTLHTDYDWDNLCAVHIFINS